MKVLRTVKDKCDILGVTSIVSIILGLTFTMVAFIVSVCYRIATPTTDINAMATARLVMDISNNSSKILLFSGLFGSFLYQFFNFKNRDDFAMWFVLIWFQVFAIISVLLTFFPYLYFVLLNLIFRV